MEVIDIAPEAGPASQFYPQKNSGSLSESNRLWRKDIISASPEGLCGFQGVARLGQTRIHIMAS
jgi:hypothetical protein